jgi:hypothetical protein
MMMMGWVIPRALFFPESQDQECFFIEARGPAFHGGPALPEA